MTTERPDQLRWPTPAGAVTPKAGHRITKSRNEGRAGHAFDDNTHPSPFISICRHSKFRLGYNHYLISKTDR